LTLSETVFDQNINEHYTLPTPYPAPPSHFANLARDDETDVNDGRKVYVCRRVGAAVGEEDVISVSVVDIARPTVRCFIDDLTTSLRMLRTCVHHSDCKYIYQHYNITLIVNIYQHYT